MCVGVVVCMGVVVCVWGGWCRGVVVCVGGVVVCVCMCVCIVGVCKQSVGSNRYRQPSFSPRHSKAFVPPTAMASPNKPT